MKLWELSVKTREERIFVSGTLTLQKALLGSICWSDQTDRFSVCYLLCGSKWISVFTVSD